MSFLSALRLIILGLVLTVNGEVNIDKFDNSCRNMRIDITTTCNEVVPLIKTASKPQVYMSIGLNKGSTYMLMMLDPDAPSPETAAPDEYFIHWIVADIPVIQTNNVQLDVGEGREIVGFMKPSPPPGFPHHYQLFLFEQPPGATTPADDTPRSGFNLNDVMNGLSRNWNNPVAKFQFMTESV